jgi:choline dehydrogenase
MLQSFRELETFRGKPSSYRGTTGKMPVGLLPANHPYSKLYIEAGMELGMKHNPDFNGAGIEGVGFYDMNVDNGRCVSAAHAFVLPILDRSNLTLMTDTKVLKLVMNGDACTGVQVRHNGQIKSIRGGEIVLSAGAVNSPEILLRSGIGASDELKALGIPTAINLPGVGRNFVDHVMVHNVVFTSKEKMPAPSGNTSESHAFWKSDASLDVPDLQLIFEQLPIGKANVPMDEGFSIIVGLVRPSSVASVKLRNTDPDSAPLIDPNYLSTEADMKKLVKGVEMARQLGNAKAFAGVRKAEVSPTKLGDGDVRKFIAENMATFWHPVGSWARDPTPSLTRNAAFMVREICGLPMPRSCRVSSRLTPMLPQ